MNKRKQRKKLMKKKPTHHHKAHNTPFQVGGKTIAKDFGSPPPLEMELAAVAHQADGNEMH